MRRDRRARYDRNTKPPIFSLGMESIDEKEFKEVIRKYLITRRVKTISLKNGPNKVRAKCQNKCLLLFMHVGLKKINHYS